MGKKYEQTFAKSGGGCRHIENERRVENAVGRCGHGVVNVPERIAAALARMKQLAPAQIYAWAMK